ncbi:MAG: hypothetical protein ABL309_13990 [Phycisphaerales bacterium]
MHQSNPNPEVIDPPGLETRTVEQASLTRMDSGHYMQLIEVARKYPRSINRFMEQAVSMATLSEQVASSCLYAIPRKGGKHVEGPTVRLAEIVAHSWRNMATESYLTHEDKRFITARANVCDLETNVTIGIEARRRITDKDGKTLSEDMIGTISQAAISVAFRNAVFKCVPSPVWSEVYARAKQMACGSDKTIVKRRDEMVKYASKLGIDHDRLFAALQVEGIEDVGMDELFIAKGAFQAIRDGEITIDTAFPPIGVTMPGDADDGRPVGDQLADRLRAAREKKAKAEADKPKAEQPDDDELHEQHNDEAGYPDKSGNPLDDAPFDQEFLSELPDT